jgi:hypothetical protein
MSSAIETDRMETLRQIVAEHQHQKIEGQIVDVQTAALLVKVWDQLRPDLREKVAAHPLEKFVAIAWKVAG